MPTKEFPFATIAVNLFAFIFFSLQFSVSRGTAISVKGYFLSGFELGNDFHSDWLGCIEACHGNSRCISYNFNFRRSICQLNRGGVRSSFVSDRTLTLGQDYIFNQLKKPEDYQQATPRSPKCLCNCGSDQSCYANEPTTPGIGSTVDQPAPSCQEILRQRRDAVNGPYYLLTFSPVSHVYCHMTEIPGCGGGGWTLVMKIDGSKSTFRYNSSLWTSETPYKVQNGKDLSSTETVLPTYWSTKLSKICLGMQYKGVTRWISINYTGATLMHVLHPGTPVYTRIDVGLWKSLLPDSSLQMHCTKQGFNLKDSASARIGIIGYRSSRCDKQTSNSRLGFGTAGAFYNMSDANSCGNEARYNSDNGDKSIVAFGYVLVQ